MTDPQANVPAGQWRTHNAIVFIEDLIDGHLINAFKTCERHDNPKIADLQREVWARGLGGMI